MAAEPQSDWRPFVLRTSGSVTEGVYGLILATSVIAVSREYEPTNAGVVAVTVLVTAVVFWLTHVYARLLGTSITHERQVTRAEVREVGRHYWPLIEVAVPLVLVLALGAFDAIPDRAAILAATLMALVELALAGGYAARIRGAGVPGVLLSAMIAAGLGLAVVLLKVLVH